MIKRDEAAALKKSLCLFPEIEKSIDALIKMGVRLGEARVSKSFDREIVAETMASSYRSLGWKVEVKYTGSDRAYSPRDEWTITFDLSDL